MTQKPTSICVSKIGDKYVVSPVSGDDPIIGVFDDLGIASGYDSLLHAIYKHFNAKQSH